MKWLLIDGDIHKGSQDLVLQEFYWVGKEKIQIRITIRSDSYKKQCYARVHRYKDGEWFFLYHIPYSLMKTEDGLCYGQESQRGNFQRAWFEEDLNKLKVMTENLLGGETE